MAHEDEYKDNSADKLIWASHAYHVATSDVRKKIEKAFRVFFVQGTEILPENDFHFAMRRSNSILHQFPAKNSNSLHNAIQHGHDEVAKIILLSGLVDVNKARRPDFCSFREKSTPLHLAIISNNNSIASLLLVYGAIGNAEDLCAVIQHQMFDIVPKLLSVAPSIINAVVKSSKPLIRYTLGNEGK